MAKITLEQLGPILREQRAGRGIRRVASEIGISPATLSRVECGKQPDLETFSKICQWLHLDAGEILGCSTSGSARTQGFEQFAAHFRTEKTLSPETAKHLSELILAVQWAVEHELANRR